MISRRILPSRTAVSFAGDDLEMPVCRERHPRVELGKTTLSKKPEVQPKDRRVFSS
jgi:hypothetical protein